MFDFLALCERAVYACPGATRVVKFDKREGGFNRVFLLTMDNGPCVVARVPTGIAGPPRLTTNSEVATITYCKVELYTGPSEVMADMLTLYVSYSTIEDLTSDTEDSRLER